MDATNAKANPLDDGIEGSFRERRRDIALLLRGTPVVKAGADRHQSMMDASLERRMLITATSRMTRMQNKLSRGRNS
jgi:hypothetical protein